jgi:D-alanyl-D-alanine carboxypeptidase
MTSGLPEYLNTPRIKNIIASDPEHQWTRAEVLEDLGSPQFAPGTQFSYNDTNYIVLGGILEQVTGRSVESYFHQRIAKPAGMSSSSFTATPAGTKRIAHPYSRSTSGTLTDLWVHGYGLSDDNWNEVWTDGGLASNALDLARFGDALMGGKLVSASTASEMANTGSNNYGLGMLGQSYDGHSWVGHNGAYGGYESENFTDRSRGVTVAVTTNLEQAGDGADSVAEQIWRSVVSAYDTLASASRPTLCKSRR